jgi:hypothetical protein
MTDKAQATKALMDVATTIRTLVVAKAPRAQKPHKWKGTLIQPGNLKAMLYKYNTPQKMLGGKTLPSELVKTGKFNLKFTIDIAPPGAEYGIYWNYPPGGNRKLQEKPEYNYGQKAMKDKAVKDKIKELGPILGSMVAQELMAEFRKG